MIIVNDDDGVYTRVKVPRHTRGGQSRALWGQVSPSTFLWIPGTELRSLGSGRGLFGLLSKCLYPLSYLDSSQFNFSNFSVG